MLHLVTRLPCKMPYCFFGGEGGGGGWKFPTDLMSGMKVDYQTILGYSLRNSLLLKYAATLRCKVKLTSSIIVLVVIN